MSAGAHRAQRDWIPYGCSYWFLWAALYECWGSRSVSPAPIMSVVLGFNFCHENLAFEYCRKGMALEEIWQQLSHTCGLGPVPANLWWARTLGMIEAVSLLTLHLGTWHHAGIYRNIWWGANSVPALKTWQQENVTLRVGSWVESELPGPWPKSCLLTVISWVFCESPLTPVWTRNSALTWR